MAHRMIYKLVKVAVCEQCSLEITKPELDGPHYHTVSHWQYGFKHPDMSGLLGEEFSLHWCSSDCMRQWYEEHRGRLPVDIAWEKP